MDAIIASSLTLTVASDPILDENRVLVWAQLGLGVVA